MGIYTPKIKVNFLWGRNDVRTAIEHEYWSFTPPKKFMPPPKKTNFWLRPCFQVPTSQFLKWSNSYLVWWFGEVDVDELVEGFVSGSVTPDVVLVQAIGVAIDQHITGHTCPSTADRCVQTAEISLRAPWFVAVSLFFNYSRLQLPGV